MRKNGTEADYPGEKLPNCDLCREEGKSVEAEVDGRMNTGQWAYMCKAHHKKYGVGLGMGKGQKLVLKRSK